MDMTLEIGIFLAYACSFFVIIFFGKLLKAPIKVIGKVAFNGLLGFIAIIIINAISFKFGFCIPLNFLTAIFVGILGLPGLILLALATFL